MILDKIIAQTKKDLDELKAKVPFDDLVSSFNKRLQQPTDVKPLLLRDKSSSVYNVICEVKKASPSKGVIRESFDPIAIAKTYEKSGASCISVLTEEHFFQGSLEYLRDIKSSVKTPLLRKDFMIDKYQIAQSYICGADLILLIAKVLSVEVMKELLEYTLKLGMDAIVEVHDEEDLQKALNIDANIIGVNHRNLDDFSMDMNLSIKLLPSIPDGKIVIAESGINDKNTIRKLDDAGIDAFLIGEYFMRDANISTLGEFISR